MTGREPGGGYGYAAGFCTGVIGWGAGCSGCPWPGQPRGAAASGASTSTRTRLISLPACAKKARSWRAKMSLDACGGLHSGCCAGNMAIRSWPVGGGG